MRTPISATPLHQEAERIRPDVLAQQQLALRVGYQQHQLRHLPRIQHLSNLFGEQYPEVIDLLEQSGYYFLVRTVGRLQSEPGNSRYTIAFIRGERGVDKPEPALFVTSDADDDDTVFFKVFRAHNKWRHWSTPELLVWLADHLDRVNGEPTYAEKEHTRWFESHPEQVPEQVPEHLPERVS